jgi:hypothetical protein
VGMKVLKHILSSIIEIERGVQKMSPRLLYLHKKLI